MEEIERIHDFLEQLPETGEVLSLATGAKLAKHLNDNVELDAFELTLLVKKSPPDIKEMLIDPYVSMERPQARFTMRIIESEKGLERTILLEKIRRFLTDKMSFTDQQIHFTNMFVLYNNMLHSLFRSQILTIGMVFLAIMVMFIILFRSLYLAVIAIIPNLLPAALVLGSMGWLGIPLDMMTITIASITIGIAVDDTIHYIHRFQREFGVDGNYVATVYRCHRSIGRAMYYTSVTIMIGFSILVLSNFIPTVYFGMFTFLAMLVAMVAALTLLPQLLITLKPLGPEGGRSVLPDA
jgi:predicted RND superfamily exporter protein